MWVYEYRIKNISNSLKIPLKILDMGICVIKKGKAPSLKLEEKNPSSVPMLIISEQ